MPPHSDHSPAARTPRYWHTPRLEDARRSAASHLAFGQRGRVPDDQPNGYEMRHQRAQAPGVTRQAATSGTPRICAQTPAALPVPAQGCTLRWQALEFQARETHLRPPRTDSTHRPNRGVISWLTSPPLNLIPLRHCTGQLLVTSRKRLLLAANTRAPLGCDTLSTVQAPAQ